jgi:hypothetical protein
MLDSDEPDISEEDTSTAIKGNSIQLKDMITSYRFSNKMSILRSRHLQSSVEVIRRDQISLEFKRMISEEQELNEKNNASLMDSCKTF